MMKKFVTILLVLIVQLSFAQRKEDTAGTITPTRQTAVHDPVLIKQGNTYFLFCTGWGISSFSSIDMQNWKKEKPVFAAPPQWAKDAIPSFKGHIWAPDISFHNNQYYLYYSVSAFGKNTSCIGLAVNKTLDPASPNFKWEDKGKVIKSVPGRDMWNAIDPNQIEDEIGNHWLVFGSFWNGIKLVKLNNNLTTIAQPEVWHTVAAKPRNFAIADTAAGDAAIEAPFIIKKDKYYYLFVSWDYCCRGEKSNYKVVVGRSEILTGPYLDKTGLSMAQNGGSLVVEGDNKEWFGAGHNSTYNFDGKYYIIYHGYDAKDKGNPKLIVNELFWDNENWPSIKNKN
jgi:arabinan endo-1,5-alpha-L-arabinosidase